MAWQGQLPVFLTVLAFSLPAVAQAPDAEAGARKALGEFISAWNTADNELLQKTLNYPHVTLFGGRMIVAHEPSQFRTDFDRLRRQGWARSSFDSITVTEASPDKVHCDVVFSRYRDDGSVYHTGNVFYIVTRQEGRWGMQLRATGGARRETGGHWTDAEREAEEGARQAVLDFFTAFNAADNEALGKNLNLPHAFLLGNGDLFVTEDHTGPLARVNFQAMREREDWHMSSIDSLEARIVTPNMVHYDLVFSRYHPNGLKYRTVPAHWILTRQDGHWGIQVRSLLPPTVPTVRAPTGSAPEPEQGAGTRDPGPPRSRRSGV